MHPSPSDPSPRPADWEAFYRDYRKPGYVAGFEITTKLGGGMFGLVFRARRMSIGKDYAIKFLQVDDETVRKAVLSELEQVKYFAQIDHPNLVSIEDRGEVDGIPFLVMAFAGTETLRDKMPAGMVPTAADKDELLRYFLQCCRGLAALHERSLVHFDIKPANVFLKGGVARLGDYGLSKLVTHSRGSLSMGRGTPYYMAPEMLQRRGDQRSDIYSLGVMLYELLCGKVPFTGDSEWEVLRKHETTAPELPPHLTSREVAVLQRCMQKDPAARFQSVHDLIAAFGAPASVGAAAWTDVRSGAALRSPPPLPGAANASAKAGTEDPVAGLGRASREAMRHVNTLAQKAAKEAAKVVKSASANAHRVVRDAVERSRTHGLRRLFAMRRLRKLHAKEDRREQVMEVAQAVAAGPFMPKVRRGWLGLVAGIMVGLLGLGALFAMVSSGSPTSRDIAKGIAPEDLASPSDRRQTFSSFQFGNYLGVVSTSEPMWVDMASRDPDAARAELLAHIERLRQAAPLRAEVRTTAKRLPEFRMAAGQRRELADLEREVEQLLREDVMDTDQVEQLIADAPRSLVVVAEQLAKLQWRQEGDYERARRLQHVLVEATNCQDLPLRGEEGAELADLAKANKNLGALWLWFVNEFGHTERTWATFLSLMHRR